MLWFSLGVFIVQNEQLLLLSHLAKTYRSRNLKIEFQSSVYIFSGCCIGLREEATESLIHQSSSFPWHDVTLYEEFLFRSLFSTFDPRGRPQSRPEVIIIFTHVIRPSVLPSFRPYVRVHPKSATAKGFGLVDWIIDDSRLVFFISFSVARF